MPDYNPDREGHRKHKWIVHKAINSPRFKTVNVAEKELAFNREGRFMVSDENVAAEIRRKYPREATVTRVHAPHPSDRGHKYFFAGIAMPWHKDKEDADKDREEDVQDV